MCIELNLIKSTEVSPLLQGTVFNMADYARFTRAYQPSALTVFKVQTQQQHLP